MKPYNNDLYVTDIEKDDIRIAYICLCHMEPDLIAHTAKALKYKQDKFFIHVDKKADILPYFESCKDLDNVVFVDEKKRIKNYWGGFNAVVAAVNTIDLALSSGSFDRFVILQGQDYPLFSNQRIHDFFNRYRNTEFCHAINITRSDSIRKQMHIGGFWFHDYNEKNLIMYVFAHMFHLFNRCGIRYRKTYFRSENACWDIYKGWAQLSLTRECVNYISDVFHHNKRLIRYFKHRFPPDEMFFHTIIYNSEFKNRLYDKIIINRSGAETLLNLTYFEYPDTVVVFTKASDYDWLKETGCLFARKINSSSQALIQVIDKEIGQN